MQLGEPFALEDHRVTLRRRSSTKRLVSRATSGSSPTDVDRAAGSGPARPGAQVLECGREDELLAEVLGILVEREARAERRDLEEDAARLAEVDRAEPEAVDDRRRVHSGRGHRSRARPRAPPSTTPRRRGGRFPRRRRRARPAARRRRRARRVTRRAPPRRPRPPASKPSVSSSSARLASGDGANARTASNPWSASSAGTSGCSAMSGASATDETTSRWRSPSGSSNVTPPSSRVGARRAEPRLPEVERRLRADAPLDRVHHPGARATAAHARILEERDVAARRSLLVRVEEVVDGRVVLVDRLLHHPQAEDARVEVDVPRRVARDAGDVVDAVERHVSEPN